MTQVYDVVIIGSGPSGLNLALYLARSNKKVAVIERGLHGGALNDTEYIENLLGVPKTTGVELAQTMYGQVAEFDNVDFIYGNVTKIEEGDVYKVHTKKDVIVGHTVTIATGVKHKKLGVKGEDVYHWSSCITCDKLFYKDRDTVVIGGGDSAFEGASELADVAKSVTLVYYKDAEDVKAEQILQDRFFEKDNTRAIFNAETTEIIGEDGKVTGIKYIDVHEQEQFLNTDGVFVYVGVEPNTDFVNDKYLKEGFVMVDYESFNVYKNKPDKGESYLDYILNMYDNEGLYAIGDVVWDNERQVAKAMGDATVVSREINEYLERT